jgi:hypothetical protein
VRHFALSPDGLPLVVVETEGAAGCTALDWTARAAAGHILALARAGGCRVLLPGDARSTSVIGLDDGWRAVHRRLARLGELPPPSGAARPRGAAAVRVRAAAAPRPTVPPPLLPEGVLVQSNGCAATDR